MVLNNKKFRHLKRIKKDKYERNEGKTLNEKEMI